MPIDIASKLLLATTNIAAATRAIVSSETDGAITVLNISNPASISYVTKLTHANLAGARELVYWPKKKYLIVGATTAGAATGALSTVDLANVDSPAIGGTYSNLSYTRSLKKPVLDPVNEIVYALATNGTAWGIVAISVSNPASPSFLGFFNSLTGTAPRNTWSLAVDYEGGTAYILGDHYTGAQARCWAINITNPASMSERGYVNGPAGASWFSCASYFDQARSRVFYTAVSDKVGTINVSNPASMSLDGAFDAGGSPAMDISTSRGNGAYNALDQVWYIPAWSADRVIAMDMSNVSSPAYLGSYNSTANCDEPTGLAYDPVSDYLYALGRNGDEIASLNVSNAASITLGNNYTSTPNLNDPLGVVLV